MADKPAIFGGLLADAQSLRSAGDRFRGDGPQVDGSDLAIWGAVAACVALVAWLMLLYSRYKERHRRFDSPRKLFHDLCKQHGLARADTALLKGLAAERNLDEPTLLFVCAEHFAAINLPAEWEPHMPDLGRLRDLLFAEPPSEGN